MRARALFAGTTLALSLALFGVFSWMEQTGTYVPDEIGFVLPAVAVMACAVGVGWRRKIIAIVLTVGGFTVFDLLARATGLPALASQPLAGSVAHLIAISAGMLYAPVLLLYPLVALLLFVGRRPSVLWEKPGAPRRSKGAKTRSTSSGGSRVHLL